MSTWANAELDRLSDELKRDGLCVLRGVFDAHLVREWRRAFEMLAAERQSTPGSVACRGSNRFYLTLPWEGPTIKPARR